MYKVIIGALVVTVITFVVFKAIDPTLNNNNNNTTINDNTLKDSTTVSIGISGEITRSGNYVVKTNSTMADLIEAAGGVTSNADERCYFFDAVLKENETYYIPAKYEVSDVCGNNPISKVNINEADESSLLTISGVGNTIAKNIVSYRESNGSFNTLEELKDVDGIGNATFSKMKNEIILKN